MKHPLTLDYPGGLEKLAEDLGNLRYDVLVDFLNLLGAKLRKDSEADRARQRFQLAGRLESAGGSIGMAATYVAEAWRISAPFMKEIDLRPSETQD